VRRELGKAFQGPGRPSNPTGRSVRIGDVVLPVNNWQKDRFGVEPQGKELIPYREARDWRFESTLKDVEKNSEGATLKRTSLPDRRNGRRQNLAHPLYGVSYEQRISKVHLSGQTEKSDFMRLSSGRPGKFSSGKTGFLSRPCGRALALHRRINLAPSQVIERLNSFWTTTGSGITEHRGEQF